MKNKLNQYLNEDCFSIESKNLNIHVSNKFLIATTISTAILSLASACLNAL